VRVTGEGDVPVGALHQCVLAGCQIVAAQGVELALIVGGVQQVAAVRGEVFDGELRAALVRAEMGGLAGLPVEQVDVVVDRGVGAGEADVAAVARDRAGLVALIVAIDQLACVIVGGVGVDIEEPGVALVGQHESLRAVVAETGEVGLEVFAGRQVALAAVGLDDDEVVQLVAALVAGDQDAVVGGEIPDGEVVVFAGAGDRLPLAAG